MKQPISWHKSCLANMQGSLSRKCVEMERTAQEYYRALHECERYQDQIITALDKGMDGFDQDRFMKKKGKVV